MCASQGTRDNGARSACPLVMVTRARAEEPAPSPTTPSTASAMRGGKVRERERETGGKGSESCTRLYICVERKEEEVREMEYIQVEWSWIVYVWEGIMQIREREREDKRG